MADGGLGRYVITSLGGIPPADDDHVDAMVRRTVAGSHGFAVWVVER